MSCPAAAQRSNLQPARSTAHFAPRNMSCWSRTTSLRFMSTRIRRVTRGLMHCNAERTENNQAVHPVYASWIRLRVSVSRPHMRVRGSRARRAVTHCPLSPPSPPRPGVDGTILTGTTVTSPFVRRTARHGGVRAGMSPRKHVDDPFCPRCQATEPGYEAMCPWRSGSAAVAQ